jgi:hypothetical protein
MTPPRVMTAAFSLGLTAVVMVLLRAPHPPAGATARIVSPGLLHLDQLGVLMAAVVLLTAQAFVLSRLVGMLYPILFGDGPPCLSPAPDWIPSTQSRRDLTAGVCL